MDGLRAARGHGLKATFATLAILNQIAGTAEDPGGYHWCRPDSAIAHVVRNVRSRFPTVVEDEIAPALASLTWRQGAVKGDQSEVEWYQEAPARLYSRPLLELHDGGLFIPRTVSTFSAYVLIQRLAEGTWPEKLGEPDAPLTAALKIRRERVRPVIGFERGLADELRHTGLPHLVSIGTSPTRPSDKLGVVITREIDAVVAQPKSGVIWVIEAKDLTMAFSARSIRSELKKYYGRGGHQYKLQQKCAEIAVSPATVATRLGAPDLAVGYQVRALFVTREPTFASCYDDRRFPFVTLDHLAEFLSGKAEEASRS
jgi:hypothetical protein